MFSTKPHFKKSLILTYFLFCYSIGFCQDTFIDNFNTVSYANNNGTQNFGTNWVENGETTNASAGNVQVNSNQLRFQNLDGISISRSLSLAGASSATLTLDYNRTNGNESILVQLWNGASYTTVATLNGTGSVNYVLVANQISAASSIRFLSGSGGWSNNETIFIDNVQFTASFAPAVTIEDVLADEDAGFITFTATHVSLPASGAFTVDYTTVDGSAIAPGDYSVSSGTLNFNGVVGDTEQIVITLNDDFIFEGDEIFTIQFTATSDIAVDISDTGAGTIQDNESNPNAPRPYEERHAKNLKGNFIMRGNTNLLCTSGCPATPVTNNGVDMGYVDIDTDGTTINSSNSLISIPAGATVEWAGLYWGGVYGSTRTGITNPPAGLNIDQVKLKEPGAATYTTINAEVRNIETAFGNPWNTFMSFAEVTPMVQAAGSGVYHIADIALVTGNAWTGPNGGWNLVVIYADPAQTTKSISVWDGYDFFGFGDNDSFTVTGLLTPSAGAFQTHAAYFGFDGEASSTGDYVNVNGTALANGLNPADNTLNGTISEFGVDVGGRIPSFNYSWGIDSDVFDASGLVPNSATTVDIDLGSSSEGIWGGIFVISNEIAFPTVSSKTFAPETLLMGDEATVTLVFDNPAQGVALTNVSLTDNLPDGMIIAPTPNASSSCGASLSAISGNNFFNASGFNLPPGASCTFTFDIITDNIGSFTNSILTSDLTNNENIPLAEDSSADIIVKVRTLITNRRITHRVNKD